MADFITSGASTDINNFAISVPNITIIIPAIILNIIDILTLLFIPSSILSYRSAPKFCPVYVAIVVPSVIAGCIKICSTFDAATIVDPNEFIAPWSIIDPDAVIENCNAIGIPIFKRVIDVFKSKPKSFFLNLNTLNFLDI